MISIDMPAGPSEVLVIAERHASPVHIVADLLSQVLNLFFTSITLFFQNVLISGEPHT